MSWRLITEEWRMKLLALGLAVLMLGAVAFSQNPPTTRTLTIPLSYTVPPNIVLLNPPSETSVTFSGLANAIAQVNSHNLTASVDATSAKPGSQVRLTITARALDTHVQVQQPPPIAVDIDTFQTKTIPLTVIAPTAPGWAITKAVATCPNGPCTTVNFTGPFSWENGLTATATFPRTIGTDPSGCSAQACVSDAPNIQVQLTNSNGRVDLHSSNFATKPSSALDVEYVSLHVEAIAGVTSSTVPLVVGAPAQLPPPGYQIMGVAITPATVIVSGDQAVLGHMRQIVLPGPDLSKSTSDTSFPIPIPYPRGTSGSVAVATVTYSITRNPQVNSSPSPA